MDLFAIAAVIVTLSALFGYVNVRFLKLPNTIGLMVVAILFTLTLFLSTIFTDRLLDAAEYLISLIDFETVLLDVLLGFLLFAGALHTNFDQLHVQRWPVLIFSTLGVVVSTFLIGSGMHLGLRQLGMPVPYVNCLLFGALISPTDPIAVLGILKKAKVPQQLEAKIVGESLFNDGVGVVVFLTIMQIAVGSTPEHVPTSTANPAATEILSSQPVPTKLENADPLNATENSTHALNDRAPDIFGVMKLFVIEVFGGIVLGLALGYITYRLMKSIDDYESEVMITLACVMGGYSLATYLHLSAPLAIVVAGLIVGNEKVRGFAMSSRTEEYVDKFWEMLDMLMNAILFVLIGLEMVVITVTQQYLLAMFVAIVVVLVSRYLSLLIPVRFFRKRLDFVAYTTTIMTWGGLRGGISIALALSLPVSMNRELFLAITYGVVVFSIIVQGLSVGWLAGRLIGTGQANPSLD